MADASFGSCPKAVHARAKPKPHRVVRIKRKGILRLTLRMEAIGAKSPLIFYRCRSLFTRRPLPKGSTARRHVKSFHFNHRFMVPQRGQRIAHRNFALFAG